MVALGDKVRDKLTPLEGVVTGIADYLGCKTVLVRPNKLNDKGEPVDAQWMDEERVEVIEAGFVKRQVQMPTPQTGADIAAPVR